MLKNNDIATKNEFVKLFQFALNHSDDKPLSEQSSEQSNIKLADVENLTNFDYMYDHLDERIPGSSFTYRRYCMELVNGFQSETIIKKYKEKEEGIKFRGQTQIWERIVLIVFALTGTGIVWLAMALQNYYVLKSDFKRLLIAGIANIAVTALFVCSLISGWNFWMQLLAGISFSLLALFTFLCTVVLAQSRYDDRERMKNFMPYDEFRRLSQKVENYLKQNEPDKPVNFPGPRMTVRKENYVLNY